METWKIIKHGNKNERHRVALKALYITAKGWTIEVLRFTAIQSVRSVMDHSKGTAPWPYNTKESIKSINVHYIAVTNSLQFYTYHVRAENQNRICWREESLVILSAISKAPDNDQSLKMDTL